MITFPTFRGILHKSTAAFSPASLNPVVWLDANDATTLFNAATGGSTPADGGYVRRWMDKSSNGYSYKQTLTPDATYCPIRLATGGPGGKGILHYPGGAAIQLTTAGGDVFRNTNGGTIIAAVKHNTVPTGLNTICSFETNTGLTRMMLSGGRPSNVWAMGGRCNDNETFKELPSPNAVGTAWNVLGGVFNYSTKEIYLYKNTTTDETHAALFTNIGPSSTGTNANQRIGSCTFSTYIGEIIIVNRVLTATEFTNAFAYMNAKWRP